MMEKLIIDTLVLNARDYKIDGFRFDIMSFMFTYNITDIQQALQALTPEKDGVDGSKIYLYGEGFNFGDTVNNQIGPKPTRSISTASASAPSTTAFAMEFTVAVRLPMNASRALPPDSSPIQARTPTALSLRVSNRPSCSSTPTGSMSDSQETCATTPSSIARAQR
jgi:hypothetical protein